MPVPIMVPTTIAPEAQAPRPRTRSRRFSAVAPAMVSIGGMMVRRKYTAKLSVSGRKAAKGFLVPPGLLSLGGSYPALRAGLKSSLSLRDSGLWDLGIFAALDRKAAGDGADCEGEQGTDHYVPRKGDSGKSKDAEDCG